MFTKFGNVSVNNIEHCVNDNFGFVVTDVALCYNCHLLTQGAIILSFEIDKCK